MDVKNEIPELLEGVSKVRGCSFKPEEHFIKIKFQNSDSESFYLEVKWRTFWFLTYCEEKSIKGAIEELPVSLIQGTNFLQATAEVKMDGEVVGKGVGGVMISGGDIAYAVQQAATIAKGRALANAGFGTVFSSAAASENGGFEVPCDGGMRTSEFFVQRNPSNPMQVTTSAGYGANTSKDPAVSDLTQASDAPVNTTATEPASAEKTTTEQEMTRDEALRFCVPIRGKHFNEILGEVMAKDPNAVRYYANNPRYRDTELQKAAKLVLAE